MNIDLLFKIAGLPPVYVKRVERKKYIEAMDKAISELYRVLKPGGVAVIEVANKRTLPKMARYVTGRSRVNPFDKKVANLFLAFSDLSSAISLLQTEYPSLLK